MTCEHDLAEKETACADGMCPMCLAAELAALRSERDAMKEALEYIRNYDNYASEGDVYIEDGNSYTHVSNYAESVIKTYSAGNE